MVTSSDAPGTPTPTAVTEIERKYDVDDAAVLPRFDDLEQVAAVDAAGGFDLVADYFDTAGGDLAAHRITVRRRVGGTDDGWHIKLPATEGRTELRWPLEVADEPGVVPAVVLDPVRAIVRDREMRLAARIATRRSVTRLLGADGRELVEIADDVVTASDAATGTARIWREWEAELMPGAPAGSTERVLLLDAVEERLASAGAAPASSASKLATALGRTSLGDLAPAPSVDSGNAASEVLLVAVRALVAEIVAIDPEVRRGEPDSLHRMRTRVRRVRSLLSGYRRVFSATDELRSRLRDLGAVLGVARDAEVMRDRAGALVDDHDEIARPVRIELVGGWADEFDGARRAVVAELSSEPYFRALDALDDLVARPVLGPDAFAPASDVLPLALAAGARRVRKRAKRADAADSDSERIPLLHETRKSAKRLRYMAEAVSTGGAAVFGTRVRSVADAAESVHDLLGEHRDSVLLQRHLRATAPASGHAFDYGVLHELERHSAALCLVEYRGAVTRLAKETKKL